MKRCLSEIKASPGRAYNQLFFSTCRTPDRSRGGWGLGVASVGKGDQCGCCSERATWEEKTEAAGECVFFQAQECPAQALQHPP